MSSLHHILAATDLSDYSLRAVERGFQLAHTTGARYTVMHALGLDALGPLRDLLGEKAEQVARKAVAHQRAALEAVTGDPARHHGVSAALQIEEGLPSTAVPAYAAASAADLVIVGARGDSTLRRFLLGSTASHLLRKSKSPVLVVRQSGKGAYHRALVPVDFSPGSELAVRMARTLAPQAHLILLNVFDVPFEGMLQYAGVSRDEIHRYRAEAHVRAMRELHALAQRAGLGPADYIAIAEHGDAVKHIVEQADQTRSDLIVMGKHGTHVTEELLLGSVTKRVLAESSADLLVVVDKRAPAPQPAG